MGLEGGSFFDLLKGTLYEKRTENSEYEKKIVSRTERVGLIDEIKDYLYQSYVPLSDEEKKTGIDKKRYLDVVKSIKESENIKSITPEEAEYSLSIINNIRDKKKCSDDIKKLEKMFILGNNDGILIEYLEQFKNVEKAIEEVEKYHNLKNEASIDFAQPEVITKLKKTILKRIEKFEKNLETDFSLNVIFETEFYFIHRKIDSLYKRLQVHDIKK